MMESNQELLDYIEKCAKYNVRNKKLYRNTDILQEAFLISEDKAYEILKDIMSRKNIENTKEAVIDEYLRMLGNGYSSLNEQLELLGGHKLSAIKKEAEERFRKFTGGTIIDLFKEIYNVESDDIPLLLTKYMESIKGRVFEFKANKTNFYKFLEDNMDELNNQAKRYGL